ncbi:hypothetical protein [Janthinobacterium sp. NKUCC06_STL]|uniref:hypothetical protein n=1 Tax=Janthinobacterium sp. NKUCC06_STL TaxID=2842127 RepID=UPI001C5AEC32|nr:hypothetical protein [Janthinobacterium sp. NKUCC06_STL]MBW3512042.1 hypothetical protein [Janthinobacterium sp. NKUCC06_STL]
MDMEIYEFEIAKNAEGGILATAGVKGADTSYRIAGPKAWGGSSTIAKINISQRDLVEFILCYAPCAYAEIVAYSAAALSGATVQAQHSDDIAVDRCAAAMKDKLASSRAKGRGGWDDPAQCSIASLSALLRVHVDKGDPLDVANIAMMIQQRGGSISAPVQPLAVPDEWRKVVADLVRVLHSIEQGSEEHWKLIAGVCAKASALVADSVAQNDSMVRSGGLG